MTTPEPLPYTDKDIQRAKEIIEVAYKSPISDPAGAAAKVLLEELASDGRLLPEGSA
jgi:hypothetical protein